MIKKKQILVSFSGGETSAYMAQWMWNHKKEDEELIFVFANTGQENEATLVFADRCSKHFGFPLVWIEGVHHPEVGKGTTHKVVDFETASRDGEPFETFISIYAIPNVTNPHCTRELKAYPIKSYARSIGWKKYYTAIGIRIDEIDRMNSRRIKDRLLYPLTQDKPMTKQKINFWWSQQPFRLELKGYQGNCKWCWKKSNSKLIQIAQETPEAFDFPARMEDKYGNYFPAHKVEKMTAEGREVPRNIRFFRGGLSAKDILLKAATEEPRLILDDSMAFDDSESCDAFSSCEDQ